MQYTEEQLAVIQAAAKTKDNLLVNALAGAAKTTTLVAAAHKLPLEPALSVAFNKRIADEMAKRMPGHITCKTLNAIGHSVWGGFVNKRLSVDSNKIYEIFSDMKNRLPKGPKRNEFGEVMGSLMKAVGMAKNAGYVPEKFAHLSRDGSGLVSLDEFLESSVDGLDVEPDDTFLAYFHEALELSIAQAWEGKIDFNDQIYMSTMFGGNFPRYPVTMVDEAQDLSALNHNMLTLMFGGRLIAVGDPNQAIYGFRGAHASSMEVLKKQFQMKELTLSTSFRCPKAVIRRAQSRVPHMTWPDWAQEGKVVRLDHWSSEDVPDGAAIICRNNAPLFSCALSLIRAGRGVRIVGSDIGAALVKVLKKLGPDDMDQASVRSAINAWEQDQLSKASEGRKASIRDRAECLKVFADQGPTLASAIAFAEHLFQANGPIQLLSGHKSKGLEYDIVFHLDPWRIPSKFAKKAAEAGDTSQLEQEWNLKYVIETRAKVEMYLVDLESFQ